MDIKPDDFSVMIAENDRVDQIYSVTYTIVHKPTEIFVFHTDRTLKLAELGALRKMRDALDDENRG